MAKRPATAAERLQAAQQRLAEAEAAVLAEAQAAALHPDPELFAAQRAIEQAQQALEHSRTLLSRADAAQKRRWEATRQAERAWRNAQYKFDGSADVAYDAYSKVHKAYCRASGQHRAAITAEAEAAKQVRIARRRLAQLRRGRLAAATPVATAAPAPAAIATGLPVRRRILRTLPGDTA